MGIIPHIIAFYRDESGATVIEYALIVALVFLAIAGSVDRLADEVGTMFNNVSSSVEASVNGN